MHRLHRVLFFAYWIGRLLLLCLLGALGFQCQNGVAAAQVDTALLVDIGHLDHDGVAHSCLLYTSPSPRDA